jgi:hypothetical protein
MFCSKWTSHRILCVRFCLRCDIAPFHSHKVYQLFIYIILWKKLLFHNITEFINYKVALNIIWFFFSRRSCVVIQIQVMWYYTMWRDQELWHVRQEQKWLVVLIGTGMYKESLRLTILHIWKIYRILIFIQFWCSFFIELIVLGTSGNMLMEFLLQFRRRTEPKRGQHKLNSKLKLSYFSSNFNAFFGKILFFLSYFQVITETEIFFVEKTWTYW